MGAKNGFSSRREIQRSFAHALSIAEQSEVPFALLIVLARFLQQVAKHRQGSNLKGPVVTFSATAAKDVYSSHLESLSVLVIFALERVESRVNSYSFF